MKRVFTLLFFLAASTALSHPGFAARQAADGPGPIALDADGMTNGVDMTNNAGTGSLIVGVPLGPQTDIFAANNPVGTVAGLAVSTDASSTSNIVFNSSSNVYGDIGVTNPGGPFFLNIDAGADTSTVNFMGSVFGTTLNLTGNGTVNFNSGSTNITATNFASDGTIGLAPNTTLIGALTSTGGANTGTLNLGGGSVLDGAVGAVGGGLKAINVVGGSNVSGVSATIIGEANAYAFNLLTNTLNVGGALTTHTGTGVINTTLVSQTLFGNIIATGAATIGSAVTVNVVVDPTSSIAVGSQFNIVHATSGTDGSVVTVADPLNPLYTFELVNPTTGVPISGTVHGDITIKTDTVPLMAVLVPPPGAVLPPTLPIAAPIVPVLLNSNPNSDLASVLASINALSDPSAVVNAVAQLAPTTPNLAGEEDQQFQNIVTSRLADTSPSGLASIQPAAGDNDTCVVPKRLPGENTSPCQKKYAAGSGWWLKGAGYSGNQGTVGAFTGYNSKILSTMLGYDAPISDDAHSETRAGLGIGYAKSTIDGTTFGTNANTYQAIAYMAHDSGPWFVDGSAAFGWNDYSNQRHMTILGVDSTASSTYSGQDYTGFVTTGYHIYNQGFNISPLASLQYTDMKLNGYTETGSPANLNVQAKNYDFFQSGLGMKVAHDFDYSGGTYTPEVHTKWLHKFNNRAVENTASFTADGSTSFTTPGMKTDANTYNIGAGLTILSCSCKSQTWSVEAVYDHDWRNDGYTANQGMLKFSRRF